MLGHELVKRHLNLQVSLVRNNLDKLPILKLVKFFFFHLSTRGVHHKTENCTTLHHSSLFKFSIGKPIKVSDIGLVSDGNGIEHSVP